MPVAPKSMQDLEPQVPVLDPAAVREQLERLVTHSLFANSKRYPALLAYVVEQTLLGKASDLKERSIGIEVFGRSPSYDANADPIVRITAGEVRKRLSQYYYDASHAGELVRELPIGTYTITDTFTPNDATDYLTSTAQQVITITLLGLLYGILAQWRKSLRPGIISHAWSDIVNVIPIRFP